MLRLETSRDLLYLTLNKLVGKKCCNCSSRSVRTKHDCNGSCKQAMMFFLLSDSKLAHIVTKLLCKSLYIQNPTIQNTVL